MQVTPATRLISYLRDFAAVRPAEPRPAPAVRGSQNASDIKRTEAASAAPAAPAAAATTPGRAARADSPAPTRAPATLPRLLPRGSLVNIVT